MSSIQPDPIPSPRITVYVLSTCPQCKALRQLLLERNISFDTVDVDLLPSEERKALLAEMRPHNPKNAFPVTVVGGKAIIGFQKDLILEQLRIAS